MNGRRRSSRRSTQGRRVFVVEERVQEPIEESPVAGLAERVAERCALLALVRG